jgi:transposase InsO family protein
LRLLKVEVNGLGRFGTQLLQFGHVPHEPALLGQAEEFVQDGQLIVDRLAHAPQLSVLVLKASTSASSSTASRRMSPRAGRMWTRKATSLAATSVGRIRRRFRCTTDSNHGLPVATNLLGRDFQAQAPNQRWVGDTTELVIPNGKMYLAAIVDLYSRFVVGWALTALNDRHLTIKALDMALRRACPGAGPLHHSDQGSTYASEDYQDVLEWSCSYETRQVRGWT